MINLLPPSLKEQTRYAKLNRVALRYVRTLGTVLVVLAVILAGTIFYLNLQASQVGKDVAARKQDIVATASFQKTARDISDRLNAIKYIQSIQTRFSLLLDDLAKVLPKNVSIDTITLTGDDKKPVRITVTSDTYNSLLAFREEFAKSSRISGVDLESITQNTGSYQASVVIGFKPGQAK